MQKYQNDEDEGLRSRLRNGWQDSPPRVNGPHFPPGQPGLPAGRFYRTIPGIEGPNQPVIDTVDGPDINMAPAPLRART